jgi:hypothetical protein
MISLVTGLLIYKTKTKNKKKQKNKTKQTKNTKECILNILLTTNMYSRKTGRILIKLGTILTVFC